MESDVNWPTSPIAGYVRGKYVSIRGDFVLGDVWRIAVVSCSSFGLRRNQKILQVN